MRPADDPSDGWADSFWRRCDAAQHGQRPVAFGGSLTAAGLLAAYRNGLLPMPADTPEDVEVNTLLYADDVRAGAIAVIGAGEPAFDLAWYSPDPRPVLTARTVRLSSGLTKTLRSRRRWVTTVNEAFDQVLAGCRADRDPRWLTDDLVTVLTELHGQGWYHSVEVWAGPELVGGAVGIGLGAVFSCDTMFHRLGGASQIALADLAVRLSGAPSRVLDLQWDSPHVRRLGAQFLRRPDYLHLAATSTHRITLPAQARTVDDLLAQLRGRPVLTGAGGRADVTGTMDVDGTIETMTVDGGAVRPVAGEGGSVWAA